MNTKILDTPYFITYSNYFKVGNKTLSFRNKVLFDITEIPTKLNLIDNGGSKGYWINRDWYSLSKIESFIIKEPIVVNISELQWNLQINLDKVFNL